MVAFTYDDEGVIGDVISTFSALRQPYHPIPAEITRLTGITDAMVAGKTIDLKEVEDFIATADLVIAHFAKDCRLALLPNPGPVPWPRSPGRIMDLRERNSPI